MSETSQFQIFMVVLTPPLKSIRTPSILSQRRTLMFPLCLNSSGQRKAMASSFALRIYIGELVKKCTDLYILRFILKMDLLLLATKRPNSSEFSLVGFVVEAVNLKLLPVSKRIEDLFTRNFGSLEK